MVCMVSETDGDTLTLTYDGDPMDQIGTNVFHDAYDRYVSIWELIDPSTGSQILSITDGANHNVRCQSFSGAHQTTPRSSTSELSGNGSSFTLNVTSTVDEAVPVAFALVQNFGGMGSGVNSMGLGGDPNLNGYYKDPISPAGSDTLVVNFTGDYAGYGFVVNPEGEEPEPEEPVVPASAKVPFGPIPSLYFIMGLSFVQLGAFFLLATIIVKMTIFPIKRIWRSATGNIKTR